MLVRTLLLTILTTIPAFGTTVTVTRNDAAVQNAEVCRFAAGDAENPFKRWLGSTELTCVASGTPIEFPSGLWNVFARAGNDAISTSPQLIEGNSAPANLSLALGDAATLSAQLPPGASGVVYAPRLGSAFPLGTVPAGETLWLFVVEKGKPQALFPVAPLERGTSHQVDARGSGPSAIVAFLQMPDRDRRELRNASGMTPPGVFGKGGGIKRESDLLPRTDMLHGALVRIRDLAPGDGELLLEGRGWVPDRRRVKIAPALTVVAEPLLVRASGSVVVNWSTDQDLRALNRSLGSCEADTARQIEITVYRCLDHRSEPTACTRVKQELLAPDEKFATVTVEDVLPGYYRAEMRYGHLPPTGGSNPVAPFQRGQINMFVRYDEIYGSVTYGGEPLEKDATIEFPSGYGFASRETSEYRGVILRPFGTDARIEVKACSGDPHAILLNDRLVRASSRYDIDIPNNELKITVTDTFTREVLPGAIVNVSFLSINRPPSRPVLTRTFTAGEDGTVTMKSLPLREIRLFATHGGYQRAEHEPFSLTKSEKRSIELQLVPLRGNRAKFVSERPFENAAVFWYSPSGTETERAEVGADGTFVYVGEHEPNETMTLVSSSHPLWILRAPKLEGGSEAIQIRFPDAAPIREFEVTVSGANSTDSRYVTLIIGGQRVPQPLFSLHTTLRRDAAVVRSAGPLHIRHIAETGPIDVLLGPIVEEVASRLRSMDFFALPQFADAPRQRLSPEGAGVHFRVERR